MFERFYTNSYLIYKFEEKPSKYLYYLIRKRELEYLYKIELSVLEELFGFHFYYRVIESEKMYNTYKSKLSLYNVLELYSSKDRYEYIKNDKDLSKLLVSSINKTNTKTSENEFVSENRILSLCVYNNINLRLLHIFPKIVYIMENASTDYSAKIFCKIVKIYDIKNFSNDYICRVMNDALQNEDKKYAKFIYHTFKNQVGDFIKPLLKETN